MILPGMLLIFQSAPANAQEYGLGFAGQPNSKDRRTQLNLFPESYFSFNNTFELSFQLRIRDERFTPFGYVFRIVDINDNNVDLIFNGPRSSTLQVVYGNTLTSISVPFTDSTIYKDWNTVSLRFNLKEQSVQLITPDTILTEYGIQLTDRIKIFFGRNTFNPVQTTDVPTMDVKNIQIRKRNRTVHHFPLDELEGNRVHDLMSVHTAMVQNPMWILPKYHNWQEHFSTILDGFAPVCFDPRKENVYMVGDEQMKIFSVIKDSIQTIAYATRFQGLNTGSQLVYDTINNRLLCYNLAIRTVFYFDFKALRWKEIFDGPDNPYRLWFHNKYYANSDSLLYIFGGYSQHTYSNLVLRYDFVAHRWDTIPTSGDVFHPRMHAALGFLEDTIYILGGFGSTAGDQVVNPRHYTDLLAFSLEENRFIKKYDFEAPTDDIDFAHSMVFDRHERSFYVLATSIFQYESYLQLVKGSLTGSELKSMGNKIPYLFHNENSFSDLYFSRSSGQLIAVTSLADRDKNETVFKVYTIAFPPHPTLEKRLTGKELLRTNSWIIVIMILAAILLVIAGIWIYKRKQPVNQVSAKPHSEPAQEGSDRSLTKHTSRKKSPNSILFFGGFQVINKNGEDITRKFSPLMKELFLLIFLYSVKGKGISVPRLTELLWFPMDAKSAKNNRAVNIAKLKHLLSEIDSCELTRKTEYWQILFDDSVVYSDYFEYYNLTNETDLMSVEDLEKLLGIVKAGSLLGNATYEWLDEFKLECSNRITDVLINYLERETTPVEPELMVRIADAILIFDIMHEEAISIKCRALTALGKHSLAKEIFNKFTRDYQSLYDEPYERSFTDIIKH
jgi:DNA-binding SARP family transcriptional activator